MGKASGAAAIENEITARGAGALGAIRGGLRSVGPLLGTSLLPFALVLYLALKGGGYDDVVRGGVGIALWGIVLIGAVVGIRHVARVSRAGWAAVGLLLAFAIWTGLSIGWSESSERSVAELGRIVAYLGLLILALAAQGRKGLHRMVFAVAAAVAAVALLALLSRLHPAWFPDNTTAEQIPSARSRLAYPLDYWNGLAALLAMGVPLLVVAAMRARSLIAQALAAAAIPVVALALFFTFSRGGIVEAVLALAVFVALAPNRLAAVPTLLAAGAGSALLIASAAQRDALEKGLFRDLAHQQGDEMIAVTLVVCIGVGSVQAAIGLAARHGIGPRPRVSRRISVVALAVAVFVGVTVFFGAGGPGRVSDALDESTDLYGAQAPGAEHLESASLSGRDEYWRAGLDAGASEPLTGIGAGTYEYWWAREGTDARFVRDAHSLYIESFGELGIPGVILILCVIGAPLVLGTRRALRAVGKERTLLAAGVGALAAFAAGAAIDWNWELAVLPMAFFLLAGAVIGSRDGRASARALEQRPARLRAALAGVAILALAAVAIPYAAARAIKSSQAHARGGELHAALADARRAEDLQPFAAAPKLQQALVLELQGKYAAARSAAASAADAEPANWRNWFVLAGVEAELGDTGAAEAALEEARALNPRSPIVQNFEIEETR